MSRAAAALALFALGCGGAEPAPVRPAVAAKSAAPAEVDDPGEDRLFPSRAGGWKQTDAAAREAIREFSGEYLQFLSRAPTPRKAVAALVDTARAAGAVALGAGDRAAAGGFYISVDRDGTAAALFRPGSRPITDGMQIAVVSVDAPRIALKQRPIDESHGFAMLQTRLHGDIDLAAWMVHPLALHVRVDRGDQAPIDVVIGGDPGEPVLSIPDVLPHLSRGVQRRRRPVRDAERLDAVGAQRREALVKALEAQGIEPGDLAAAEAYLIPAARPLYVGSDRGLIGGYGQRHRALAYAAIRGLAGAEPERTAVVVVIDGLEGPAGRGYAGRALAEIVGRLAPEADVYDTQRSLSRSAALVAIASDQGRNQGARLNVRSADSLPPAIAAVTRALDEAGVHYQLASAREETASRHLSTLDLDAVDLSIAVTGAGTPGEVVSVFDLYQGFQACRAWLSH